MERITWFFLVYCCCVVSLSMAAVPEHSNSILTTDQSALLALKARASDPDNMILANWSTTTPVCNWVGVTCAAGHLRVSVLNISYFGLSGTIPPELGNLSFLVELQLTNNSFHGTLPQELARLRRLKFINLGYNKLTGIIPSWFGYLSKLETFSLYGNHFIGSIPAAIFNLSALKVIDVSYNQLSGSISRGIGNLTMLKQIYLNNNNFEEIPDEIASLDQLEILFVRSNTLKGPIPMGVFNMSSLITLNLYGNSLSGKILDNICQHLQNIQVLNLGNNQFDGPLPSKLWQCKQLLILNLENNKFSGSIPNNIGNLTQINAIGLGWNNLTGSIPREIGNLDKLKRLFVQLNTIRGHIPTVVFNMSSLVTLNLYGNSLSGKIPDNICQHLQNIQVLNLGNNQFDGALPPKLWQCKQLLQLNLEYNKFSGSIPNNIGNLTKLNRLALNNNNLTGRLPANIGLGVSNLQLLYLGTNKLYGVIPKSISNASQLTEIDLGVNIFSGFIPSELCALTNLQYVRLSSNNLTIDTSSPEVNILSCLPNLRHLKALYFSYNPLNSKLAISFGNLSSSLQYFGLTKCNMRGNIPKSIGNLSNLTSLYLNYNQLTGSIPTIIGRLRNLQGLFFNVNKLQGYIPDELCQLEDLSELSLDGNQLTGSVPSCLGNLTRSLRVLSLGSNMLNSTIPSTLWGLTYLLELNLSSNHLTGSLSQGVGNLEVVQVIDLSNNQLFGTMPSSIGDLQNLVQVILPNNSFEGPIPSSLGNSLSLEFLDFSKNNLSGVIPKSLEALLYLRYLNLSFNRLQGEIPTGGPFVNISDQSFVSNDALCGAPRFHVPLCQRKTGRSMLKYIIIGIISTILLVALVLSLMLSRKKNVKAAADTTFLPLLWKRVSYQELLRATNGFDIRNLLGTGSFGSVYKGTLSDGMDVAIKVFNLNFEGDFTSFDVECEMLANIRHRNLIRIINCCSQIDFKAAILNYMPNGSLDKWLYSQNFSLSILQRLNIMIDVALALQYLHHEYETPIVHCDLKPSNILLDGELGAHVADFGIAKLLGGGNSMTRTMTLATIGYMAPEYAMEGIVSTRGDVYSFGIVVMETFTKRKPTDEMFDGEMSLKQWVASSLLLSPDTISEVVDANLLGTEDGHDDSMISKRDCLTSIMRLALACSTESPVDRRKMQEVVVTLNKIKIKFLKEAFVLNRPVV